MPEVTGYKVHGDKIRRMGVPIYLRHTCARVEGMACGQATIAPVDSEGRPLLEAKTFADTVLIAVGLASVDEYLRMPRNLVFL